MDLKEFTFRLILLFFPGLVAFVLFDRLTIHKKPELFVVVINSALFGFGAYGLVWLLSLGLFPYLNTLWSLNLPVKVGFWNALQDSTQKLEVAEIFLASVAAVLLALIATVFSNRKIHYWFARIMLLSKKSGELDVWAAVMNSRSTAFVTVRDTESDLMYDGWIQSYSEDHQLPEMMLRDVAVYRNSTGAFLYQIGAVYLKLNPEKVVLEFRGIAVTQTHQVKPQSDYEKPRSEQGGSPQRGTPEEGRGEPDANRPTAAATAAATAREPAPASREEVISEEALK
ncbi:MAG: hypothetical protein JWR26_2923 [Pedosphaera sp.]|nr:hypothetical protein [Pedosphaera sp.]